MSKILLVDDDKVLRRVFERSLQTLADVVLTAANGREAYDLLQENTDLDLIISDWMMPEMDGNELLRRAKENPATRDIPFVMLTAKDRVEDAVRSLTSGADDYIRKPCHISEVIARAKNLIKAKRLQEELQRQAITDGLTGLFNHRHFMEVLEQETERAIRYQGTLTLLLFDIDHFKRFNDTYGHQVGDAILSGLGSLVHSLVRKVDIPARYGGEEFAVILPGTTATAALIPAERLLEAVRTHPFVHEGQDYHVTVSLGIAERKPDGNAENLVKRADAALYTAKREGRDRLSVATD